MISVKSIFRNPATLILLCGLVVASTLAADESLEEAIRLYDAGRYAEAKPILERIVAAGGGGGITQYRLFFCQRSTGDPRQQQSLELARTLLEGELAEADGFEVAFYLSNTYANLGLSDQIGRVATEAIARFEAGDVAPPTTTVEQFRLGKLYADQTRDLDAAPWFEKAVDGFSSSTTAAHRMYLQWAARWLGDRAVKDERFEEAAKQFTHVCVAGQGTLEDYDNLGLASLMIGEYSAASKAWQRAILLNPGEAGRYRYGSGLAQLASRTPDLPISPDGERGWHEVGREELETLLKEQAQVAREIKAESERPDETTAERRKADQARIAAAKQVFVGAAVEYMRRGLNLREAAFFGGYAPLVFHAREWEIGRAAPRGMRKGLTRPPGYKTKAQRQAAAKDDKQP